MAPSATRLAGGPQKASAADVGEEALHTGLPVWQLHSSVCPGNVTFGGIS